MRGASICYSWSQNSNLKTGNKNKSMCEEPGADPESDFGGEAI